MRYFQLIIIILILLGCESKQSNGDLANTPSKTIITGVIRDYNPASMRNKMICYYYDAIFRQQNLDIEIDSSGQFKTDFELPRQQDVNIYFNNWMTLILKPGDSVSLSFNGYDTNKLEQLKSTEITGDSDKLNKELHRFLVNDTTLQGYYNNFAKLTPESFSSYHDSIFTLRHEYISTFLKQNSTIEPSLINWLKVEKDIKPVVKILEFPMYYGMYNREKAKTVTYPDSFFNAVLNMKPISPESMVNGSLSGFGNYLLFHYYEKINPRNAKMDGQTLDSLTLLKLRNDFKKNPMVAQLAITDRIKSDLEGMNTTFIENNEDDLKALYGNSNLGRAVFKAYEETKTMMASTELPEDTETIVFNSNNPEDYLQEIIDNAGGKVVYIDHWATWCAPCRSEFENALPEFKKKYYDQIQFVYLCYSSKEDQWEPLIKKYNLSGKHYFVKNEETEILSNQMNVTGYPTYTIINQEGTIVKSDFMYRPSQSVTSKIIDSLLNKTVEL
jgi:thiol-disulfide isomerase/thioredoxin